MLLSMSRDNYPDLHVPGQWGRDLIRRLREKSQTHTPKTEDTEEVDPS